MRLAGLEDVDIALDEYGQPAVDPEGNILTVSGDNCWLQDIRCESLTQEGELLHEDEEGRWAYGFGLMDFLNVEEDEALQEEAYARVREKLTKREFIEAESIKTWLEQADQAGMRVLHFSFSKVDETAEQNIDIRIDGTEVEIE